MRILLDTNIIVSGLLGHAGPPGQLLNLWGDGYFTLVTSLYQLSEFRRVIGYKHLRGRISPAKAGAFLHNVGKKAVVLEDLPDLDASPDPKDNPILSTAISGNADLIVSGDKGDMIALREVHGIPIITARAALKRFGRDG